MSRFRPSVYAWIALVCLVAPPLMREARAGAWTQPAGAWYARLGGAGIDTRERFDGAGRRVAYQAAGTIPRDAAYVSRELRGYGEYGWTDRLTGYGALAYKQVSLEEATTQRDTWGTGDLQIGARWRMTPPGSPPVSVATEVRLPTGYDTADQPALGSGRVDGALRLLGGLSGSGWYATADLGWMVRGGSFADQFLAGAEAGGSAARLGGRAVLRLTESARRSNDSGGFDPALASPRLLQLDVALDYEVLPDTRLEIGWSHALAGRDALAGNTIEVALVRRGQAGSAR